VTLNLETLTLSAGCHPSPDEGACVMEAVSFVAREPWSDHPVCASAVIGAFLRSWNDSLDDDDRDRLLKPLVPRLVGTAGTPEQEDARAWMALDWLVRVHTPAWLRTAGVADQAGRLESLPEFRAGMDMSSVQPTIDAVRKDAAAAGAAAWAVARAADSAATAARAAAWAVAGDAARAAAKDVLRPTVEQIQVSALELVDRMIAVTEVHSPKMGSNN